MVNKGGEQMRVAVTFRNVRGTDPLRRYAEQKLGRVAKYLRGPAEAHVVLAVSKYRQTAEISVTAKRNNFNAKEETQDLYSAIDLAVDKIERQVKKHRARVKSHKGSADHRGLRGWGSANVRVGVLSSESFDQGGKPLIIRSKRIPVKPMSVEEAVMQMDLTSNEFLVFRNASSEMLSVVYRRRDGNYGLIEPEGE